MSYRGAIVSQFIYDEDFAKGIAAFIRGFKGDDISFGEISVTNRIISGRVNWFYTAGLPLHELDTLIEQIEEFSSDCDEAVPLILIIDETGLMAENRVYALRKGNTTAVLDTYIEGQTVIFGGGIDGTSSES